VEPLVLWPSIPKLLLGLGVSLAGCLLAIWGLVHEGAELWDVALLVFAALAAVAYAKVGLRRYPMLVLDDEGVTVWKTRLRWHEVERVCVDRLGYRPSWRARVVSFVARDERALLDQMPAWVTFLNGLFPKWRNRLSVVAWMLPVRRPELLDEVRLRYSGPVTDS
jgi:hypothetical protein